MQSFGRPGGFLAYIDSYFSWRKQLWSQVPLCAELVEIAVLMNSIASNQVASPALNHALRTSLFSLHSDPYSDQDAGEADLPNLLGRRIETAQLLLSDDAHDSAEEGALPACSDDDLDIFYAEVFDPYFALIETFQQSASVRDLPTLIDSLLEWRRAVWLGLPACEGMAEITWHITNSASDMAVLLAFHIADMKPECDLYNAESSRTPATIAELTPLSSARLHRTSSCRRVRCPAVPSPS